MEEERSVIQIGGSVEKAEQGEYNIDVKSVLNEAWSLTVKSRLSINVGLIFTLCVGVIVTLIASQFLGGIEAVFQDQQASGILNVLVTLLVYPFLVGVEMMGVFHAVGVKTSPKLVLSFLKRGSWVAICALLSSTLVTLGFTLFYVPGIYIAIALSLVLPLVAEKRMSPFQAITLSLKATRFQWFKLCGIYSLLFFSLVAACLPIAILAKSDFSLIGGVFTIFALTYLAPLFYNVKGILYREIFGMQLSIAKGQESHIDTTFSA